MADFALKVATMLLAILISQVAYPSWGWRGALLLAALYAFFLALGAGHTQVALVSGIIAIVIVALRRSRQKRDEKKPVR